MQKIKFRRNLFLHICCFLMVIYWRAAGQRKIGEWFLLDGHHRQNGAHGMSRPASLVPGDAGNRQFAPPGSRFCAKCWKYAAYERNCAQSDTNCGQSNRNCGRPEPNCGQSDANCERSDANCGESDCSCAPSNRNCAQSDSDCERSEHDCRRFMDDCGKVARDCGRFVRPHPPCSYKWH